MWSYDVSCGIVIHALYHILKHSSSTQFKSFNKEKVLCLLKDFIHLLKCSDVFALHSVNMSLLHEFAYFEPSFHPWDGSQLIVMNDFLNVLLDLICLYFTGYSLICVNQRDCCLIFLTRNVFVWYCPHKISSEVFLLIFLWNTLRRNGIN